MKYLNLLITTFLIFSLQSCSNKNNLQNSVWKRCGDDKFQNQLPDFMFFRKENGLYVKNDTIYAQKNNSFIGVIDTIENYYGEKRLFIKDINGSIERYCEQ